jgi:hypothetical protein
LKRGPREDLAHFRTRCKTPFAHLLSFPPRCADGWAADDPCRAAPSFDVPAIWTPDGNALTLAFSGPTDDCSFPSQGVATLVPGQARRVVMPARNRKVVAYAWSPDGTRLAVELAKVRRPRSQPRGQRHPWPRSVAREFELASRRGDRAARRIVLRAVRALRRGAGRKRTLRDVRIGVRRLAERFDDASDSAVDEAFADALDPWLRAAGFERIEGLDEVDCL